MASQLPFDTLLSLAKDQVDAAVKHLGALNVARTNARRQFDMLMEYRQDYLVRLQTALATGMSASDCQNYQRFICTLDDAIAQQTNVLDTAEKQLAAGRLAWQEAQRRHNAYDALLKRDQMARNAVAAKREQNANDEFASRRQMRLADA